MSADEKSFGSAYGHILHPLMNIFPSWKIVFSLDQIIRERYFHHLEMNSYLHQEILHWKVALFFIHWNRMISVIIILDVSCKVVWCLITSYYIYSGTRNWNATTKKMIVFLQRMIKKAFICMWYHFKNFTGGKAHTSI